MANNDDLVFAVSELKERTAQQQHAIARLQSRVDKVDERYEAILDLSSSVQVMAEKIVNLASDLNDFKKGIREDVTNIHSDITKLNSRFTTIEQTTKPLLERSSMWKGIRNGILEKIALIIAGGLALYILQTLNSGIPWG